MHWRSICWLAHIMRWVLTTPFGSFVEPEVNRNLTIVSGPVAACAAAARGARLAWRAARRTALSRGLRVSPSVSTTSTSGRHDGGDRLRVRGPAREHQARRGGAEDVAQLAVVLRHQRVRRRHRHERHAGPHRAERQRQVLEIVVGQDRDRPLGRQPALASAWPTRCARSQHLRVARCAASRRCGVAPGDEVRSGAAPAQCSRRSVRRADTAAAPRSSAAPCIAAGRRAARHAIARARA